MPGPLAMSEGAGQGKQFELPNSAEILPGGTRQFCPAHLEEQGASVSLT